MVIPALGVFEEVVNFYITQEIFIQYISRILQSMECIAIEHWVSTAPLLRYWLHFCNFYNYMILPDFREWW